MPDVQEVFRMATQKVRPDPGALERQHRSQRRRVVRQKIGVFALAAALAAIAVVVAVSVGHIGRSVPANTPTTSASPLATFPQGTYSVKLDPGDFRANGFDPSGIPSNIGIYTWTFISPGSWYFQQQDPPFNAHWGGTYEVSGNRVTFRLDKGAGGCPGWTWSLHWATRGSSLVFSDLSISVSPPTCRGPQAYASLKTMFQAHPFVRI